MRRVRPVLSQGYTPSQRGNYHHSMFHNPTAAVNLFRVGKQYLTFCKAEAAVTRNLIGRKIISNFKRSDARNSLPILDVIRSSHKRHSASECCKWTLRQTTGVCYTCSERHLTFRRNIDTRRQWSVGNIGWKERFFFFLSWEMVINDHCHGSVSQGWQNVPWTATHIVALGWQCVQGATKCAVKGAHFVAGDKLCRGDKMCRNRSSSLFPVWWPLRLP